MPQYTTQVLHYDTGLDGYGMMRHLIIKRCDGKEIQATWSELQQIKNETVGEETIMVEMYPSERGVINEVNWRHFWEIPPELIFTAFDIRFASN